MLLHQSHHQRSAPHLGPSHTVSYGLPLPPPPSQSSLLHQQSRKRPRDEDLELDVNNLQHNQRLEISPHLRHSPVLPRYEPYAPQSRHHHHHTLPAHSPPAKIARRDTDPDISGSSQSQLSHNSVVGQAGMPTPAIRPRGPKLKFTPEDDGLLIDLKENKALTWKQIADFFPGRSSGTLQVRYCTKLKAKTSVWTDDMLERLRNAINEYEQDRWRIIALKVGPGFTPAACKEKSKEI